MKKVIFLLSLVLILGVWLVSCGGGDDEDECPDISGNYQVTKQIQKVKCWDANNNEITLSSTDGVMDTNTTLKVNQLGCDLVVTEDYQGIPIPYTGFVDVDDYFEFDIESPDQLELTLTLDMPQPIGTIQCKFSGYIYWTGDVVDSNLTGKVVYDLDKHPNETNSNCPESVRINATFNAQKQ